MVLSQLCTLIGCCNSFCVTTILEYLYFSDFFIRITDCSIRVYWSFKRNFAQSPDFLTVKTLISPQNASIIPDSYSYLLCLKLCQHNRRIPTKHHTHIVMPVFFFSTQVKMYISISYVSILYITGPLHNFTNLRPSFLIVVQSIIVMWCNNWYYYYWNGKTCALWNKSLLNKKGHIFVPTPTNHQIEGHTLEESHVEWFVKHCKDHHSFT